MGKSRTWLLISNYRDWTNMRNKLVYELAKYVGMPYTPDSVYVSLYINHQYRGLYLLTEKLQVADNRIELDDLQKATQAVNSKPLESYSMTAQSNSAAAGKGRWYNIPNNPSDISGTYLFKIDQTNRYTKYKDEPSYSTTRKVSIYFR